jgi:hypothetical protein
MVPYQKLLGREWKLCRVICEAKILKLQDTAVLRYDSW